MTAPVLSIGTTSSFPQSRPALLLLCVLVGCGPAAAPTAPVVARCAEASSASTASTAEPAAGPSSQAAAHPDAEARAQLFDDLVGKVRRYHVFAPAAFRNLGRSWDDDLRRLRAELVAADSPPKLSAALRHFGNSLRDPHCRYLSPGRPSTIDVGFTLDMEWDGKRATYYVASIRDRERAGALTVGDVLLSVDGVAGDAIVDHFDLETNANSPFTVAYGLTRYLTHRTTEDLWAAEGKESTWVFRRRQGDERVTLKSTWKRPGMGRSSGQGDWDPGARYDKPTCARRRSVDYGPYELTHAGWGVCAYTSKRHPYRAYPIVRQYTFSYSFPSGPFNPVYLLEKDQLLLSRALGPAARIRGVILDLRDNGGGNNPNWFLDWWAPGSYVDDFVHYRVHPDLVEKDDSRPSFIRHDDIAADYRSVLKSGAEGERTTRPWPFFCPPKSCDWDNRYTPKHRVTKAPIALLVGPRCVSTCDSFSRLFSQYQFGALIGQPTAAAHTTARHRLEVSVKGLELGELTIAVSYEVDGKTRKRIEGVPIRLDRTLAPSFENRERYDALLVEAAIAELKGRGR